MDTYYTIEEKYLKAVEELNYGETPRSLKLLNEILADEPLYPRAHYQMGKLYYYDLKDYKAAGYHFKLCAELDATFPDVYYHYIKLLVFLNMDNLVNKVAQKALTVPGVYAADIYNQMALCCENNRKWNQAIAYYNNALMRVTDKQQKDEMQDNLARVKFKMQKSQAYVYHITE
jgi:tetratricopeptide (TPR) repeat protein